MKDLLSTNDGSRPSRLDLDRALTGEAPLDGHDDLLEQHRAEVEATPLPPLDLDAIRQRAEPEVIPLFGWKRVVPLLMAALALLFVALPNAPENSSKGATALEVYVQRDGDGVRVQPGGTLAEGDRVRFATRADGHETVVVLSVDGRGVVSLFYPEDASDPPVAVDPWQRQLLDDAIELDDAVGPESFVAIYSPSDTAAAVELVQDAYEDGGHAALAELSRTDPGVAVLTVEKSP